MQIYVHRGGQQLGPFTDAEIKAQLTTGTISPQDLVWWEGQAGWVPLGQSSLAATPGSVVPPPVASMTPPVVQGGRTSGLAIASLVCGVSSLLVGITCIPAIILGHLSLGEIKKNPGMQGRGMAIGGLVLGYLLPLLFVVIVSLSVMLALGQTVHGVFSTTNSHVQRSPGH